MKLKQIIKHMTTGFAMSRWKVGEGSPAGAAGGDNMVIAARIDTGGPGVPAHIAASWLSASATRIPGEGPHRPVAGVQEAARLTQA